MAHFPANEFLDPRIEWPGREVEPLEVDEVKRQTQDADGQFR